MVDVNNFVKLLCYIFEKGKLYREICLEIRSETLAFLLFSLFTGGGGEVAFCNLIINPFSERVA
ncbi:hypothetical protein D1900_11730 [Escherichia coli]|nr:hypothetical protein D1900_11730 [Escherichia coli]